MTTARRRRRARCYFYTLPPTPGAGQRARGARGGRRDPFRTLYFSEVGPPQRALWSALRNR